MSKSFENVFRQEDEQAEEAAAAAGEDMCHLTAYNRGNSMMEKEYV